MNRTLQHFLQIVSVAVLAFVAFAVYFRPHPPVSIQEEQLRGLRMEIQRVEQEVQKQERLFDQIALLDQFEELRESHKRLEDSLTRQTALLARALGTSFPIQIPPALGEELISLEAFAKDPNLWPTSKDASSEYTKRVSDAVKQMPPWAEANHLGQLNTIRWAALVFELLQTPEPSSVEELASHVNALREATFIAPDEIPAALQQEALAKAAKLETLTKQKIKFDVIAAAEKALEKDGDPSELIAVAERLREFHEDQELLEIFKKVRQEIGKQEIEQQIEAFAQRFDSIQTRVIDRPAIYEHAISVLATEVGMVRLSLLLEGNLLPSSLEELNAKLESTIKDYQRTIAKKAEEKYAKEFRAYQVWALGQIKEFDATMETAEANAKANSRVYGEKWSDAEYNLVKDAIVNRLLPVNPALLDIPVNERYHKAFQRGWMKLENVEDRDDQTYVAEQGVKVEKKSLASFEDQ